MKEVLRIIIVAIVSVCVSVHAFAIEWGELEGKIKDTLESLALGRHYIETEYRSGTLTVSGYVASEQDRVRVIEALGRLPAVHEVKSKLDIKQASARSSFSEDDKIRSDALEAIKKLTVLGSYEVDVQVEDGIVLLVGTVTAERDLARIGKAVENVRGVTHVQNRMRVATPIDDARIADNIREAWAKESDLDTRAVTVEVLNGIATLHGSKSNHREIDRLLSLANMADGVREVKSEMTIRNERERRGAIRLLPQE